MVRCTAPSNGPRTASGREACPACRNRSRGFGSYLPYSAPRSSENSWSGHSSVGGSSSSVRPRWSRTSSPVMYTPAEVRTLTPPLELKRTERYLRKYFFVGFLLNVLGEILPDNYHILRQYECPTNAIIDWLVDSQNNHYSMSTNYSFSTPLK